MAICNRSKEHPTLLEPTFNFDYSMSLTSANPCGSTGPSPSGYMRQNDGTLIKHVSTLAHVYTLSLSLSMYIYNYIYNIIYNIIYIYWINGMMGIGLGHLSEMIFVQLRVAHLSLHFTVDSKSRASHLGGDVKEASS